MDNLAIKHGYYFEVDRDDERKYMHVEIGQAYRNDDVENFTIKSEGGFLKFFINGEQDTLRDQNLSNSFEDVADSFLEKIINAHTKMALVKRVNSELVSYFEEKV
jgi:hypothetical protein